MPRRSDFSASILAARVGVLCPTHVPALRCQQRRVDVLGQQARIIAAPGADDDTLVV